MSQESTTTSAHFEGHIMLQNISVTQTHVFIRDEPQTFHQFILSSDKQTKNSFSK